MLSVPGQVEQDLPTDRGIMAGFSDYIDPEVFDALLMTESSGNPLARNPKSGARGMGQITEIGLKDWNQEHGPDDQYTMDDMYDMQKNMRVAHWTLYERIPQFLKNSKLPQDLDHALATYNYGIGNLKESGIEGIPQETKDYIRKIKLLLEMNKQGAR